MLNRLTLVGLQLRFTLVFNMINIASKHESKAKA